MKDIILEKFADRLVRFEPKPFDNLLQDKTKKILYEIGIPSGATFGSLVMDLNGELTLLPENKIQICFKGDKGVIFFLDTEKNDALYYRADHWDKPALANSSLENFIYCLYEQVEFYENIYYKKVFGDPDTDMSEESVCEKYAKYLEERIRPYEQWWTIWDLEIEEIAAGNR